MLSILGWLHLRRLSHILRYSDFHIEGFAIFLFVLGIHFYWLWIILFIYLWKLRKRIKLSFFLISLVIISLRYVLFINQDIPKNIKEPGIVTRIENKTYYQTYTLSFDKYQFNVNAKYHQYKIGDVLYIEAEVKPYRKQTIPLGFNAHQYYRSKDIKGYLSIHHIEKIGYKANIMYVRYQLLNKTHHYHSQTWINSFLFGESVIDNQTKRVFSEMGFIHLLQISGIHIYILMLIIKKMLFYCDIDRKYQDLIALLICLFFAYLHHFDISLLRLWWMYVFVLINQRFKLQFSKLDLIQFVFLILLIYKIELTFSLSFLILYLIINFITLVQPLITKYEKLYQRYILSLVVFCVLFPFYKSLSIMTILLLPLFTWLISGPLFLMVIGSLLLPVIDQMTVKLFDWLVRLLSYVDHHNSVFYFPALSPFMICVYFFVLIYLFRANKSLERLKRLTVFIIITFYPYFSLRLSEYTHIYFLDVGQGDTIYIESNRCRILIDAYAQSQQFLKNKGVNQLDYLILSHSDGDHTKEAYQIVDHIRVKQLVISANDQNHTNYSVPVKRISTTDKISCGHVNIEFFVTKQTYQTANNSSLVFKVYIHQTTILFTGDIEKQVEHDLSHQYGNQLKADILKVAHHGSSTSSTQLFLSHVKPSVAIISLGYENRYGFPSQEVIQRLSFINTKIYRTDTHGTIVFSVSEKKQKWAFYLPF